MKISIPVRFTLLLSMAALSAQGQQPIRPLDHMDALVAHTVRAINAGHIDSVRQYIKTSFAKEYLQRVPEEDQLKKIMLLGQRTGGVAFAGMHALDSAKTSWELRLQDQTFGLHHTLSLRTDAAGKIDRWLNAMVPKVTSTHPAPQKEAALVKDMAERLQKAARSQAFSGIVYLAKGEKVLLAKAVGSAAMAYRYPNTVQTRFSAASLNKMFTAIAIAQLYEAGKLHFNDTVGKWLDSTWMKGEYRSKITIHHLLSHRSGLGTYFYLPGYRPAAAAGYSLSREKTFIRQDLPEFEPGSGFRYSNTGFFLLGVIIEKITGQHYYDYIQQYIYDRAGMVHSGSFTLADNIPNLAFGYSFAPLQPFKWEALVATLKGSPAGGGYVTAPDLHRFFLALQQNRLVQKETLQLMLKNHSGEEGYGYGFFVTEKGGETIIGHSGGTAGVSNNVEWHTRSGYISIVLSNFDQGAFIADEYLRNALLRLRKG